MAETLTDEHPMLRPALGRLKNKVAVITGANSGIGRATAGEHDRPRVPAKAVQAIVARRLRRNHRIEVNRS